MEIKNETLYDRNLIIQYNKSYFKAMFYRRTIPFAVLITAVVIVFFFMGEYLSSLAILLIFLLYMITMLLMEKISLSKVLKSSPIVETPFIQSYQFGEESIDIQGKRAKVVPYDQIRSIHLYGDYLVITTLDRFTAIINITRFTKQEDYRTLEQHLIKKAGKRIR